MIKTARHTVNHRWVWLIAILFLPEFIVNSAMTPTPPTISVLAQAFSSQSGASCSIAPFTFDQGAIAAKPGIPQRRKGGGSR